MKFYDLEIKNVFKTLFSSEKGLSQKEAENRLEKEIGDYLIYIISRDNDKVIELRKE